MDLPFSEVSLCRESKPVRVSSSAAVSSVVSEIIPRGEFQSVQVSSPAVEGPGVSEVSAREDVQSVQVSPLQFRPVSSVVRCLLSVFR